MSNVRFIFWFGSPQQQVDMHARSKKHFHCLIICIYFYLTCSTTPKRFSSTIHFSKALLCVTLICGDWSDWSHFHFFMPVLPDKVVFVSTVLLCVQRYWGNRYFYRSKAAPSGKELIYISFRPTRKDQWLQYANVWCWRQHERLGIRFKNDSFQWFRVDSFFWETITLYTVHFQI